MPIENVIESVLALPAKHVRPFASRNGFTSETSREMLSLLLESGEWHPRNEALERNEDLIQPIAYTVFLGYERLGLMSDTLDFSSVLSYQRSRGEESRLDQKRSIGIGGHVSLARDTVGSHDADFDHALLRAEVNEVREEGPNIESLTSRFVGFLYDASEPVGRVHLGVIFVRKCLIDPGSLPKSVLSPDPKLSDMRWCAARHGSHVDMDLGDGVIESWSRILLSEYLGLDPIKKERT